MVLPYTSYYTPTNTKNVCNLCLWTGTIIVSVAYASMPYASYCIPTDTKVTIIIISFKRSQKSLLQNQRINLKFQAETFQVKF